jgi:hypothetical protein
MLYHGSTQKGLKELRPATLESRKRGEKPLLFATPELPLAIIFISREIRECGMFNDVPYAVIRGSKEEYVASDKGGSVYELPGQGFEFDPSRSMNDREWFTRNPIKPLKEVHYPSCLEAMIDQGVQVFFVNSDELGAIKQSPDHGLAILQNMVSENERRNRNFKPL